ncbi:helix-hairpin-helix domain-containing protein [Phosphitispora fastidiosa]|uniref:helix-hairpin-helix domain-containing protein n=1 Tax=Phosphitispora fastidiosa TaxID=2837202 RepID=UPI001E55E99A|nr:helix-hairpin-helix domain-containing protein [Phosphitispora fastidiosa]MBU7005921.1 competence protein ComEA [Phosphitispora fastidiosa]
MWTIDRKHLLMGVALLCAIVFGIGFKAGQMKEQKNFRPVIAQADSEQEKSTEDALGPDGAEGQGEVSDKVDPVINVHVAGAVEKPGVYTFAENARVLEGVNKAVPAKDADLAGINLAEVMLDQQQVIVPRRGEAAASAGISTASGASGNTVQTGNGRKTGKININTAGAAELVRLPGIGPATAQKIIDRRKQQGGFKDIREIMNVSGIGEKKYSDIKDQITV